LWSITQAEVKGDPGLVLVEAGQKEIGVANQASSQERTRQSEI
jgi:hypothetical protein